MICRAVPSSLGPRGLVSAWADPVECDWEETASKPVVGSVRGMTSMASAEDTQREKLYLVYSIGTPTLQ